MHIKYWMQLIWAVLKIVMNMMWWLTMNGCSNSSNIFFSFSMWSTCLLSIISFFFIAFIANFASALSLSHAYFTFPNAPKSNVLILVFFNFHFNKLWLCLSSQKYYSIVFYDLLTFSKTSSPDKICGFIRVGKQRVWFFCRTFH